MIGDKGDHFGGFTEMVFDPASAVETSGLCLLNHMLEITIAEVVCGAHLTGFDHPLCVRVSLREARIRGIRAIRG